MTTSTLPASATSAVAAPAAIPRGKFDREPLSWIIVEIRDALNRSGAALILALGAQQEEERSALLQQAQNHLHQAHGALQVVEVEGAPLLTAAVEHILERAASVELALTPKIVSTIEDSYSAVNEYLQELLAGEAVQPVSLFGYYRDLLQAHGAERIHPADLFFIDSTICPTLTELKIVPPSSEDEAVVAAQCSAMDYSAIRKRFEKALLPFLKSGASGLAGGELLHDIIGEVEHAQADQHTRAFWWVMRGFAEAVATGRINSDLYVKQLLARINLQIRRLSEGSDSIADHLLHDALFFIAGVRQPTPLQQQIQAVYKLAGQVPENFDEKRYARVDSKALSALRERLTQAKIWWNRLVGGERNAASPFEQEMLGLSQAGEALMQPALAKLLRELNSIARAAATTALGERLGLEMATSLLFVENALAQIGRLPANFSSRAEAMTARLLSTVEDQENATTQPSASWIDDMSRLAQQRQTVVTIASELQSSLRQVEKMLEQYFSHPAETAPLTPVDVILHQVGGALAVMDQDEAARAVAHTQKSLQRFTDGTGLLEHEQSQNQFADIARNIGALGFFVETLHLHDAQLEKRFYFDDDTGIFQARLFERVAVIPDEAEAVQSPAVITETSVASEVELVESVESAEPAEPALQTDEQIDAELLEIFLIEAVEVLDAIRSTLPLARHEPHNQEYSTTLRRAFHTLKGSGRMVGLMAFGEAAWSIEQLINVRLAQSMDGDDAFYALLDTAVSTLSFWVNDLQTTGHSERTPTALIDAAALQMTSQQEQEQEPQHEQKQEQKHDTAPASTAEKPLETSTVPEELSIAGETPIAEIVVPDTEPVTAATKVTTPSVSKALVIEFPPLAGTQIARNDNLRQIGDIEISVALHSIYISETDGLVRLLSLDFGEWRHEPERPVSVAAAHAAHSLAGTSATVGLKPLQEVAQALETVLQQLTRSPVPLLEVEFNLLDQIMLRMRFMLQLFALGEMADHEPTSVSALSDLQEALLKRLKTEPEPLVPPSVANVPDVPDVSVADNRADEAMPTLAALLSKKSAEEATAASIGNSEKKTPLVAIAPEPSPGVADRLAEAPLAGRSPAIKDELDADLMPVFIEEASDMLPQMGQLLRTWQATPGDTGSAQALLRLLHTIKGSARMAGAMRFGQHMHELESRIEQVMHLSHQPPQVMEDLLSRYDQGLQMFDTLQRPATATPTDVSVPGEVAPQSTERRRQERAATDVVTVNSVPVPLVRVRADILDRLVNQAGEVSIARSRLENEIGTMRQSLGELTENITRLREQLREVEMQAESQIENQFSSQRENSPEKQFDPLEFDRFTRLQELTRMMAESVNDVTSVQQTLARTLESATIDLTAQARLTRDLQQDLMSVRMVQFASVTERLYRVTRQVSKEIDKRVNLDIRGSAVELDRSVLEKMAGPFEHLLRNAIVHGIESRADRQAAGKSEIGELQIDVRQEGNEVVIEFSDDGQGLRLERIRSKAQQTGLLGLEDAIGDVELADLIFHPGFSTAAVVTELAGRGIGMDVVRAEASALGGRVAIDSEPGRGARFTIHLPLTLAVTQVVLLSTGGKVYAVPSVLVEQVQQLKMPALAAAYNDGAVTWQAQRIPMIYLASLLGDHQASAVSQQYSPLIILKSGSNRLAVHVDEIMGNHEVVVKNIGPQVARLAGIAGATVLGSGEIVLILNPVALAQRSAHEQGQSLIRDMADNTALKAEAPDTIAGADENTTGNTSGHATPPSTVSALQTRRIVMVVDDSLTVRRVTQRLLSREGYQVMLAKDGIDALEQLQSVTPDAMLVDIEMPRMDGFDLTRNLRGDERTRHIPVIMITSRSATKHRNHAFELGIDAYLGKPYQEEVLLAALAGFVHNAIPVDGISIDGVSVD